MLAAQRGGLSHWRTTKIRPNRLNTSWRSHGGSKSSSLRLALSNSVSVKVISRLPRRRGAAPPEANRGHIFSPSPRDHLAGGYVQPACTRAQAGSVIRPSLQLFGDTPAALSSSFDLLAARILIGERTAAEPHFLPRTVGVGRICFTAKRIDAVLFSGDQVRCPAVTACEDHAGSW